MNTHSFYTLVNCGDNIHVVPDKVPPLEQSDCVAPVISVPQVPPISVPVVHKGIAPFFQHFSLGEEPSNV